MKGIVEALGPRKSQKAFIFPEFIHRSTVHTFRKYLAKLYILINFVATDCDTVLVHSD